jgi:CHASE2 domain-containing sensor protein
VTSSCTVIIAASDLLPTLKERIDDVNGEVLAFSDSDALRALEVITKRRPRVVALERLFAATPRGAALINRIKADPSLVESEIRVVSHDCDDARVARRKPMKGEPAGAATSAPPLDQRGTRRAARFKIAAQVDIVVDGNTATLVDLSRLGAQVVTDNSLNPNQRVRMLLSDQVGVVRLNASVAWAKFEIPPGKGPQYRAGLDFVDADGQAVDGFCDRHKAGI